MTFGLVNGNRYFSRNIVCQEGDWLIFENKYILLIYLFSSENSRYL
jgi:hypothetical protein